MIAVPHPGTTNVAVCQHSLSHLFPTVPPTRPNQKVQVRLATGAWLCEARGFYQGDFAFCMALEKHLSKGGPVKVSRLLRICALQCLGRWLGHDDGINILNLDPMAFPRRAGWICIACWSRCVDAKNLHEFGWRANAIPITLTPTRAQPMD